MSQLLDIAWLGGLLEGEGCFMWEHFTHRQNGRSARYSRPVIQLFMTDGDTVERAAKIFGINPYSAIRDKRGNRKPGKRIQVYGKRAIGWMQTIYLFLGERRKAKVQEIVKAYKQYKLSR